MSGGSVCVFLPNGRRQAVKCSPNTTILQVLEEVCKKQDLKPEDHDLKHHNKILDTTQTFRFSGLPNNAQLELVDAVKKRVEGDITLALNLENGSRLVGNFKPTDTLLVVVKKLCPNYLGEDKHTVVIYTRREIYGKELEDTTLRSLGITGGRAMLRLINKPPEELRTQANVSAPLPHKPTVEQPYKRVLQRVESPPRKELEVKQEPREPESTTAEERKSSGASPPPKVQKSGNIDLIQLAKEKRKSQDRSSSPTQKEERRKSKDFGQTKQDLRSMSGKKVQKETCQCKRDESMEVDCCGTCQKRCTNVVEDANNQDEFIFLDNNNAMLFSLESAKAIPSEQLPDDFFELTINDARKILRDMKMQRHNMENQPLTTTEQRKLEESKKQLRQLNKYKKAIIRVQFPDRNVLQGTFSPIDTIKTVCDFVKVYLEDKSLKFYLCKSKCDIYMSIAYDVLCQKYYLISVFDSLNFVKICCFISIYFITPI
ncbi:unnamed protein product [Acanthoscelides obtectus]|uniref:RBD domain-containing protein n=1 Tax=Acanthoscelides obtectus TaxID=200917 RepID=A0A9P0PPE6_ACAOB|nr:unnamed protein product [Acanthoscelides obtectus]CAK1669848.1 Tether containing UBX domain for GLUT4 [Acanthoscelides obtectus]